MYRDKKDEKALTAEAAIQKLRKTEEMLWEKQDFLEKKINTEITTAKTKATENKTAALQALRKKKRYEKLSQQIDGTLTIIEMEREALEGANTNTAVLTIMENTAQALEDANKHMDVDQVHNMMEQEVDEDELEKELEELKNQALEDERLKVCRSHAEEFPSVPQGEVEDDEMEALTAWTP